MYGKWCPVCVCVRKACCGADGFLYPPQMQHRWLVFLAVVVSSLVACHAQYLELLGGLALLKGVAIAGYAFGRHGEGRGGHYRRRSYHGGRRRYGRALVSDASQEEDVLLSSVTQYDSNGCLLKLVCLAQATPEEARTSYQAALVHLFTDMSYDVTPTRVPFVQALQTGSSARKVKAACDTKYMSCPLPGPVLHGMLVMAWNNHDQQTLQPSI